MELVTRKLAEIDAALKEPPEVVQQILAKHIDILSMKPADAPRSSWVVVPSRRDTKESRQNRLTIL